MSKRPRVDHTSFEAPSSDEDEPAGLQEYEFSEMAQTIRHYGANTQSGQSRTWGSVIVVPGEMDSVSLAPSTNIRRTSAVTSQRVETTATADNDGYFGDNPDGENELHLLDDSEVPPSQMDEDTHRRPLRPSVTPFSMSVLSADFTLC